MPEFVNEPVALRDFAEVIPADRELFLAVVGDGGVEGLVRITDALQLIEASDLPGITLDELALVIAGGEGDETFADTDAFVYLSGGELKLGSLTGLLSSVFKTGRTIGNAQFAAASFKLFNAAGTPRALKFNTTALTADRDAIFPDRNLDFTALRNWTVLTEVATTSGTTIDWTSIPATAEEIEIYFRGVAVSGSDRLLVQIGPSGTPVTTGYVSGSGLAGGGSAFETTSGFGVFSNGATYLQRGRMRLAKITGNLWTSEHTLISLTGSGANGAGDVTLVGPPDIIRLRTTGTNTFTAGSVVVRYR
jgi:hypothetical protein